MKSFTNWVEDTHPGKFNEYGAAIAGAARAAMPYIKQGAQWLMNNPQAVQQGMQAMGIGQQGQQQQGQQQQGQQQQGQVNPQQSFDISQFPQRLQKAMQRNPQVIQFIDQIFRAQGV